MTVLLLKRILQTLPESLKINCMEIEFANDLILLVKKDGNYGMVSSGTSTDEVALACRL